MVAVNEAAVAVALAAKFFDSLIELSIAKHFPGGT